MGRIYLLATVGDNIKMAIKFLVPSRQDAPFPPVGSRQASN
jgi:hypothetical protein